MKEINYSEFGGNDFSISNNIIEENDSKKNVIDLFYNNDKIIDEKKFINEDSKNNLIIENEN